MARVKLKLKYPKFLLLFLTFAAAYFIFHEKNFMPYDKKIMNSIFARGLAAAVLAQLAIQSNLQNAELIAKITFAVIMFTIVMSSIRIFLVNKEYASPKAISKT